MEQYSIVPQKNQFLKKFTTFLITLVLILLFSGLVFLFLKYQESQKELERLQYPEILGQLQEERFKETVSKVRKIILLPEETPTVAKISDIATLKKENPEFYANARNGDKLILFTDKVVIFREEENMIINVAPIKLENTSEIK